MNKLPTHWCILRTSQNSKVLNNWFNKNGYEGLSWDDDYLHHPAPLGCTKAKNKLPGYTTITFEQFQTYVLKQKIMKKVTSPMKKMVKAKQLRPLNYLPATLGGYKINRRSYLSTISFGCGEIEIAKKDLELLAAALPALKRIRSKGKQRSRFTMDQVITKLSQTTLKQIIGN